MKCLLFIIITLTCIGRIIDVQGNNDEDFNLSGNDPVSDEIAEDNPREESEKSTDGDKYDGKGDENTSEDESADQKPRRETKIETLSGGSNSGASDQKNQKQHVDTMARYLTEVKAGDEAELVGHNQHISQSHYYHDLGRRTEAQGLENIATENLDYLTPEKAPPELVLLVAKESAMLRAGKESDLGDDFDRKKLLRSGDYWNAVWKEEVKPKSALRSSSQKKKRDLENIAAENVDHLTPEKAPPELVLLVAKESAMLRAGKESDLGDDFDRKKLLRSGDYWNAVWKEEVKPKSAMRSSSQKKKLGSIKAKINPGTELYKVVSRMKKISPQLLYIINKKQLK